MRGKPAGLVCQDLGAAVWPRMRQRLGTLSLNVDLCPETRGKLWRAFIKAVT